MQREYRRRGKWFHSSRLGSICSATSDVRAELGRATAGTRLWKLARGWVDSTSADLTLWKEQVSVLDNDRVLFVASKE